MREKYSILFVCLGNICRSPLAAGVFIHLVKERKLHDHFLVDSCGTGDWHEGEKAHVESIRVAKKHGVSIDQHRARQICRDDLKKFNLIVAMDRQNERDIRQLSREKLSSIIRLREYDHGAYEDFDVPDPYGNGPDSFQEVYDIVYRSCENLLGELETKLSK